jgi:hypothetical protein
MYDFVVSISNVLPCGKCCEHYQQRVRRDLQQGPSSQPLDSGRTLSIWMWKVHNEVNQENGKPIVPFSQIEREYAMPAEGLCRATTTVASVHIAVWIVAAVLVVMLALVVGTGLIRKK